MEVDPAQMMLNILPLAGLWSTIWDILKYGINEQAHFISQAPFPILWHEVSTYHNIKE